MGAIRTFLDRLIDASAWIAGAAVVVMMLHVTVDVVLRFLFGAPPPGTITFVANYYMVALVCLPLAFVERTNGHIGVEVLTERFSPRVQYHLRGIIFLPTAAVVGLVAYASWIEAASKYAINAFVMEQSMRVPIWYGYFALPVGYALFTLYLLLRFAGYVAGAPVADRREHDDPIDGVPE